jgi:WS/DGAT/MGAT family acyltransferase
MHVGWSAVFAPPTDRDRPTLDALRTRVASRLDHVPWCRWRLQTAPLGISEPAWVDDPDFDVAAHVLALGAADAPVSYERFSALRDGLLSQPLERSKPMWQIFLIPRLEDGRVGMIGKIHHALVDGMAALQIVGLVVDEPPEVRPERTRASVPAGPKSPIASALSRLTLPARAGFTVLRATAGAATQAPARVRGTIRDATRVMQAAREDLLPRAPDSALNVPIGPRRTLAGYHATRAEVRAARAGGGTLNDIGLAVVAGALRALAISRGDEPQVPLKAMVPVSMRRASESGPGNRISMVYIQLPVNLSTPAERLDWVRAQTQRLKTSGRAEGTQTLYAAGGLLPAPLRTPLVKAMSSRRAFNLTVSQSPGPRGVVHVLGCELQEVYSVVPIADKHALAIGMVRYRHELFIGCYADPDAFPGVHELPALLEEEMHALASAPSPGLEPDADAPSPESPRSDALRPHAPSPQSPRPAAPRPDAPNSGAPRTRAPARVS